MTTFVLVHGAFHGSWCWEQLAPLIEDAGHRVASPDLLDAAARGGYDAQVASVVGAVPEGERVVLVGHSLGGMMISAAAQQIPDRIDQLVYVAAYLPLDGESALATNARVLGERGGDAVSLTADGAYLAVDSGKAPGMFYTKCDPKVAAAAAARLRPEPLHSATQELRLTDDAYGRVPRAFIRTDDDQTVPLEAQLLMLDLRPCDPVVVMQSDHSPFFSMPEEFAETLLAFA